MWVEAEYKEQLDKYSTDKFTVTVGFDRFVGIFSTLFKARPIEVFIPTFSRIPTENGESEATIRI